MFKFVCKKQYRNCKYCADQKWEIFAQSSAPFHLWHQICWEFHSKTFDSGIYAIRRIHFNLLFIVTTVESQSMILRVIHLFHSRLSQWNCLHLRFGIHFNKLNWKLFHFSTSHYKIRILRNSPEVCDNYILVSLPCKEFNFQKWPNDHENAHSCRLFGKTMYQCADSILLANFNEMHHIEEQSRRLHGWYCANMRGRVLFRCSRLFPFQSVCSVCVCLVMSSMHSTWLKTSLTKQLEHTWRHQTDRYTVNNEST